MTALPCCLWLAAGVVALAVLVAALVRWTVRDDEVHQGRPPG